MRKNTGPSLNQGVHQRSPGQVHDNLFPNQGNYVSFSNQAQQNGGYNSSNVLSNSNQNMQSHSTELRGTRGTTFLPPLKQIQTNGGYNSPNRFSRPSDIQNMQPHSHTIPNRVSAFMQPLKQEQSSNVHDDTNQMCYGKSNHMVPFFQSTGEYSGRSQMNYGSNFLRPNSDIRMSHNIPGSAVSPSSNPSNDNAKDRYQRLDKFAASSRDCESLALSRSLHRDTNEDTSNRNVQLQRTLDIHGHSSNTDIRAPTPQRPRPIVSAAPSIETENAQMSSLAIEDTHTGTMNNLNCKVFGSTEREKMFIFTGTVEKIIKWNSIFRNHFCYFEVIASVVSIQEGSVKTQKVMLLRDKKGPVLQVVYYLTTHLDLRDFYIGQMIRCVGRMSGQNVFNAVSIRGSSEEEVDNLQRLCLICDQAVSHYLKV